MLVTAHTFLWKIHFVIVALANNYSLRPKLLVVLAFLDKSILLCT